MSELDPNAEVLLVGSAQYDSGDPIANQEVGLVKEADLGEVLGGIILGPATVLACLGDTPPAICQHAHLDRSDSAGDFRFSLLGRDTQGSLGNASYFTVTTGLPPTAGQQEGPSSYLRFQIQSEEMHLPPMELWQTALAIENTSQTLQLSLEQSGAAQFGLRFEVDGPWSAPLYQVESYDGSPLDARIFEDAQMAALVTRQEQFSVDGRPIDSVARSASYALSGKAGAPPSRYARCFISASDGSLRELQPCELSDGELARAYSPLDQDATCEGDECEASHANQVALLDLGDVRAAELLVLRLGYYEGHIEISKDAQSWTSLGMPRKGDVVIEVPAGTELRYLRVTASDSYGSLAGLSELSVW